MSRDGVKDPASLDWAAYFFDTDRDLVSRMMRAARRRFGDSPDAESAYNHALDGISADDWKRLRDGYKGKGRADGFLAITFSNLLEDYAVRKYGRKRPPKWIQDLGGMWPKIYRMLCLQRLLPETIVDAITSQERETPQTVRLAITQVGGRVADCGQVIGETNLAEGPVPDAAEAPLSVSASDSVSAGELNLLMSVLADVFPVEGAAAASTPVIGSESLNSLRAALKLEDLDRLILKLVYVDGFSIARAARALNEHEQQVRRRHKALIALLGDLMKKHGLE